VRDTEARVRNGFEIQPRSCGRFDGGSTLEEGDVGWPGVGWVDQAQVDLDTRQTGSYLVIAVRAHGGFRPLPFNAASFSGE
jgi:hypothetical protein